MEHNKATKVFDSLASEPRLAIFRLLVKYHPDGLVAGQISTELDMPASNLSFHLKTLVQSSLLTVEQKGRYLRYRANIDLMHKTIHYLTSECCSNNSSICIELRNKNSIIVKN